MPNPEGAAAEASRIDHLKRDWLPSVAFVVTAAWSLWLYVPWTQTYLDRADFNEFLPFLKQGRNFLDGFQLMSGYYWAQGRFFPLTVAYTAAKWSLFGTWAPGWQWTTFALMLLNVVALYRVARRFGASIGGSCAAGALMIVSVSAVESWCRVHFSEAPGTFFFLVAVYFASQLRQHPSARKGFAAAVLLACAILTKETFIAVVPFVILVELCHTGDGQWAFPSRNGGERRFATIALSLAIGAAIPAIFARVAGHPHAYSVRYGTTRAIPALVAGQIHNVFLPAGSRLHEPLADLLILTVIISGLLAGSRHVLSKQSFVIGLSVLLILPLCGLMIYLPWPQWSPYYAMPYLLALAVLVAQGFTFLIKYRGNLARVLAVAALVIAGLSMTTAAKHQSSELFARRQVVGESIDALADYVSHNPVTEIIVPQDIPGTAASLERFAKATRPASYPPFRDTSCDDDSANSAKSVILRFSYLCRARPVVALNNIYSASSRYRWLDFQRMQFHTDEYSVAFFAGGPADERSRAPKAGSTP